MWLHVPSGFCPSSPAAEVSISASDSLCQTLARSVMWRSTFRRPQSWALVLRTGVYQKLLSGLTLPDSMAARGVERWISSWAASPALICPSPESKPELKANIQDSGLNTCESFAKFNPDGSLSKMCPVSSVDPDADTHAYVAGLVDGEGCLGVRNHFKSYYACTLEIGMSTKALPILNHLWQTYGGSISISRNGTEKWSSAATWTLQGKDLATALKKIGPALRLKKEQSEIILKLLSDDELEPLAHNKRRKWTDGRIARYKAAAERMTELNQKGPTLESEQCFAQFVGGKLMTSKVTLFGEQWEMFSGRLPKAGSMRSGFLYERPTFQRRTGESACSSSQWPTVTSQAAKHATASPSEMARHEPSIASMAVQWPSPRSEDSECCGNHPGATDSLTGATKTWKTPHGMAGIDATGKRGGPGGGEFAKQANNWPTPRTTDQQSGRGAIQSGETFYRPSTLFDAGEKVGQANLSDVSEMWQTPATDSFRSRGGDRKDEMGLDQQARLQWTTPNARDWKSEEGCEGNNYDRSPNPSRQVYLSSLPAPPTPRDGETCSSDGPGSRRRSASTTSTDSEGSPVSQRDPRLFQKRLNPYFVELLMGLPAGWTSVLPLAPTVFERWATQFARSNVAPRSSSFLAGPGLNGGGDE